MNEIAKTLAELQAQLSKVLQQASTTIQAEADRLEATADAASGGTVQPVTRCTLPQSVTHQSIDGFAHKPGSLYYSRPSWQENAKVARAVLASSREAVEKQHQINRPVLENNRAVTAQVKRIMTNLGIPESRTSYGYQTPRARKMTSRTVTAGYISDLIEVCKTDDSYQSCCKALDAFEQRINEYERKQQLEASKAEAEVRKKDGERGKLILLGRMSSKYNCSEDIHSIIEALCSKDKYFALAYWLLRNRTNWHDGPACAEQGLSYFLPLETEEDQLIHDEISGFCEDWDGDGRVFRDCTYNYTFLFEKAAPEIMADYNLLEKNGLLNDELDI